MTTVSSTTSSTSSTTSAASTSLLADYDLFLQLLTTQMTNQDPLDPMDTSDYTQQLVQYSQVEQSIQQNGTLEDILTTLSGQQMSQASNYIGQVARFNSPVAGLADDPAHWTYYVDGTAASLTATITDASGNTVRTLDLDTDSEGSLEWDGLQDDGTYAEAGAYTLTLNALDVNGETLDTTINSMATVSDVVTDGTDIMLGVNGIRMSASGLIALSAATE
ncbi:flagellar hook assembly protein FlgD [Novosphingobium profundi]|uniref:flagellar hook assembly protein FlgD n=1 Tax=Novosphingobium profundi TaxID=1774954 RepID=UPI001BDB21B0|nr:flagellar hook capping FlgD N-terminal domain-containing protein [Novosphingobium profundi]MBT0670524.1 flagellar hook assembly protein FlgD [Novosphingobium profundi]